MISLLAIDIDGTLLDSGGQIPEANRTAISRALDAGIEVVLATGRRFDFARTVVESLPRPFTFILSNGAIVKTHDGETLVRNLLPRETARHVLAHVPEHRETAAVIFDRPLQGQVVFESVDWEHPRHSRFFHANRPYISELRPLEDALSEDPVQVMFTGGCAAMRSLFDRLRILAGRAPDVQRPEGVLETAADGAPEDGEAFSVALTEYIQRDFSLVDVVRARCSKGAALRQWTERRGLSPAGVMAIGDNLNDLEMLEYAGRAVLVANALPELKQRGWAVTASNDEAGVARAIETFALGEAS
ncbi:MAG TPA: HAD-IIB family hydrolase [Vicinamibacterales bacterium]|nr:HAD-IIB family hydrolase [Vicinamibacterales bacterium]